MNTSVYVRRLWIVVMSAIVVLLAALLVAVSHEAMGVAAALERRLHQDQACDAELRMRVRKAQPPDPVARASEWTPAEERQLQARVQAIVEPHDGQRR
jgi:hypothetical protein